MIKVKCIKQPKMDDNKDRFIIGKVYEVFHPTCDSNVWRVINEQDSEHAIRNEPADPGSLHGYSSTEDWFHAHFEVVDDLNDAYDRAMGIL